MIGFRCEIAPPSLLLACAALTREATRSGAEPARRGFADGFTYELAVERDDGSLRRARFDQGAAPVSADALVAWVIDGPHGHRHIGR